MTVPTLGQPIVFIHGLCGFDYLRLGRWRDQSAKDRRRNKGLPLAA